MPMLGLAKHEWKTRIKADVVTGHFPKKFLSASPKSTFWIAEEWNQNTETNPKSHRAADKASASLHGRLCPYMQPPSNRSMWDPDTLSTLSCWYCSWQADTMPDVWDTLRPTSHTKRLANAPTTNFVFRLTSTHPLSSTMPGA